MLPSAELQAGGGGPRLMGNGVSLYKTFPTKVRGYIVVILMGGSIAALGQGLKKRLDSVEAVCYT